MEKFGRIWPDWGNTAWADMAVLGSIGLKGDTLYNDMLLIHFKTWSALLMNSIIPNNMFYTDNITKTLKT